MPVAVPLVTIGLPVYNGARYLRAALDEVLAQTFGDWELILSDNASTDDTEAIARDYAARDARIRYVRNATNVGALANANQTIRLARGRYFALAAYDDRHAPDFLARLVPLLEADPGVVLAYSRCERIDEEGNRFAYDEARGGWVAPGGGIYDGDRDLERPLPADAVARYRAVLGSMSVDAAVHGLMRTDVLRDRIGGHGIYGSDRLVVAHAALLGRFVYVDEPLFEFRIHAASTLHLDHDARVAREAPGVWARGVGFLTLAHYARAVAQTDLGLGGRLRAWAATAGYALGRARRNVARQGRHSYLPWLRPALGLPFFSAL
ncbi:MAG TPA: glycosyltransferase [Rhodothermales bacterium]|nr:glycosyltransferase [Rhodothermales bacterium]